MLVCRGPLWKRSPASCAKQCVGSPRGGVAAEVIDGRMLRACRFGRGVPAAHACVVAARSEERTDVAERRRYVRVGDSVVNNRRTRARLSPAQSGALDRGRRPTAASVLQPRRLSVAGRGLTFAALADTAVGRRPQSSAPD